jgi:hypothetical protein
MNRGTQRQSKGVFLEDGPLALWIILFFICLPLVDFGAVLLRSTFLYMAVHNAARNASQCRSFLTQISSDPSSVTAANSTVGNVIAMWNGVTVNSIITQIVITNINTSAISYSTTALTSPPDDENNTYQIEVSVTASVAPLVTFDWPWFGSSGVPGLTKPMNVTMSDRQFCENPQGLIY